MDNQVSYVGIIRRVIAYCVDQIIYLVFWLFILFLLSGKPLADIFNHVFYDTHTALSIHYKVLEELISMTLYIALETLMILKLGWTPGKLLCGIYVKDANTLKNITLMQAVVRSTTKELLCTPVYISMWFIVLPILILVFAIFDKHKQCFYDKVIKTVVIDYRSEVCYLNCVGVTRRAIAYIVDSFIIVGACSIFFFFTKTIFDFNKSQLLTVCLYFLLSIVLGIFMVRKFNGTPGQLLCCIGIKDIDTLKNATIVQLTIRYISFKAFSLSVLSCMLIIREFADEYDSEWWLTALSSLIFIIMILIVVHAVFDKRKQFFHDKIARTVAIDYKPSS